MITAADLVVVIVEKERWPSYLQECNKVLFWDIQDPVGMADESADEVYRQVQRRVEQLVAEIGEGCIMCSAIAPPIRPSALFAVRC